MPTDEQHDLPGEVPEYHVGIHVVQVSSHDYDEFQRTMMELSLSSNEISNNADSAYVGVLNRSWHSHPRNDLEGR